MPDKYRCKNCGVELVEGVDDIPMHVIGCAVHINDHVEPIEDDCSQDSATDRGGGDGHAE